MSKWFSEATEKAILIRWLILKCILFSIMTWLLGMQVAFQNIIYENLDTQAKLMLWAGIFVLWIDKMIAFFDSAAAKLAKGELPIANGNGGDTSFVARSTVKETTINEKTISVPNPDSVAGKPQ